MTIFRTNTALGLSIEPDNAGNIVFISNNISVMRMEPSGIVDLSSARLIVPIGNTNTRSNVQGSLRFNSDTNAFETFNGSSWYGTDRFNLEYLAVGGGGGGGPGPTGYVGGGGGGGGVLSGYLTINKSLSGEFVYLVTVGSGGAIFSNGSNSTISSLTAFGGGGGAQGSSATDYPSPARDGRPGGSGGGGSATGNATVGFTAGGLAITGQGYPGGRGVFRAGSSPNLNSAGGGGASQAGQDATPTSAGKGGDGAPSFITGANVIYAGGGGGASFSYSDAAGGLGGGGAGAYPGSGISGNVNTGGGGGGGGVPTAGTGGSGIVILAHSNTISNAVVSAGLTYTLDTTTRPGNIIYSFTAGTGTIYWN